MKRELSKIGLKYIAWNFKRKCGPNPPPFPIAPKIYVFVNRFNRFLTLLMTSKTLAGGGVKIVR